MFNFPAGIPIPHDVHEQYALNVKTAWTKFHEWWVKARDDADGELVDPNKMPTDVRKAFDLINETPIPARDDGATGADSCYIISVKAQMSE
ncbi:MAG: hypothetical protein AAB872_00925 [Patescibacteria group bacterium]